MILTDIHMPGLDGISLTERLKSNPETRHIPVVLLTGTHEEVVVIRSLELGADDYLKKPIGQGELRARVDAVHRQYRTYRALEASHRELKRTNAELVEAEAQLFQSQKLEAIGRLAAGIAHEINTPLQFVGDNITFVSETTQHLDALLNMLSSVDVSDTDIALKTLKKIQEFVQRHALDQLIEEVPIALEESKSGIRQLSDLVHAMKEFSHPGGREKEDTDINHAIESTVTVARNEWKYCAVVETELEEDLPPVPLLRGEFNQVLLNLIVNAAHAIEEHASSVPNHQGVIRIVTKQTDDAVEIRLRDNGAGIPRELHDQIFDPFFTTKEIGRGTGQGLAIARSVIVDKHQGELFFKTNPDLGTEFVIRLPRQSTPLLEDERDSIADLQL